jgi:hypothetical protein
MDQGIIANLKVNYRNLMLKQVLQKRDDKDETKLNILDAMLMMKEGWTKVTSNTVANCFRHCSFALSAEAPDLIEVDDEDSNRLLD